MLPHPSEESRDRLMGGRAPWKPYPALALATSKLLFQTPREDRHETQPQSSQEGHRPVRPREQKSFDCWACGEMGRGLAGQAQEGQVLRWSVNSHRLQEAWSHHLRQSKAPLVGLDISCHPHPCSEALLFVYWDDFNFQQWVYLGGQEDRGYQPDPTRNLVRLLIPASRGY